MKAKKVRKVSTKVDAATKYVRQRWDTYNRRYSYEVVSANELCCNRDSSKAYPTKFYAVGGEVAVKVTVTEKK